MIINPGEGQRVFELPIGNVYVRTFGFSMDVNPKVPTEAIERRLFVALSPEQLGEPFQEAMAEAGFEHHLDIPLDTREEFSGQGFLSESRPVVQVDVPSPNDMLLVAMKIDRGIVQFHLPESTDQPRGAHTLLESARTGYSRFIIPISHGEYGGNFQGKMAITLFDPLKTVVRFFKVRIVDELLQAPITTLTNYIANKIESHVKDEQFRSLADPDFPVLTPDDLATMSGEKTVLFIHGILSSIEGAFHALGKGGNSVLQQLSDKYNGRLIGWDHWTVSKTMTKNAIDLLNALPDDMDVHIVCHSRGGAVTRAILEDPALKNLREKKLRTVNEVIFVAGANQGSPLANPDRLVDLINVFNGLYSLVGNGSGVSIKVIVGVLKVLLHGVFNIPSLRDLTPGSKFYQRLNGPYCTPAQEYCYVRANFDEKGISVRSTLDTLADSYIQEPNDLVVPFKGAMTFDPYLSGKVPVNRGMDYGDSNTGQSTVLHTNYFEQAEVRDLLLNKLL
ncbi:MAG: hypothetical protein KKG47_06770 [Proteobacteria bacterium]|nr:hypothetical protein [Pseudomonadota bacterium]MBU1739723.1 hypothetical protein [Pseudomonadota bacterium]